VLPQGAWFLPGNYVFYTALPTSYEHDEGSLVLSPDGNLYIFESILVYLGFFLIVLSSTASYFIRGLSPYILIASCA